MPTEIIDPGRVRRPHPVNLRDLGGTRTIHGTTVQHGRLLRSDDPAMVEPAAIGAMLSHIGLVVDLRSTAEEEYYGLAHLPANTERLRSRIEFGSMPSPAELADELSSLPRTAEDLGRMYADGIRANATALGDVFERIADERRGSLVHCVAGKDRTGVVIALLLTAIDVPRQQIVADYAATASNMPQLLATAGHFPGATSTTVLTSADDRGGTDLAGLMALLPAVLLDAPEEAMEACLRDLDESHGSPLGPLREAGMDASVVDALIVNLVQGGG